MTRKVESRLTGWRLAPGSQTARAFGCTCPSGVNAHAAVDALLYGTATWEVERGCPLHGDDVGETLAS